MVGAMRADGVIAQRMRRAGLEVLNPALEVVSVHNEQRAIKDYEGGGRGDEGGGSFFRNGYTADAALGEVEPVFLTLL